MKAMVLYYSKTGTTKQMAQVIAQGMESVDGVQAKVFSLEDIDADWAKESKCVILGTPIYMASIAGEVKSWLESPAAKQAMAGRLGGAFATADYIHGGGELGIRTIFDHMLVYGMLTYSGGGVYGKPVIHLGPVAIKGKLEESTETFALYGTRMATKAIALYGA